MDGSTAGLGDASEAGMSSPPPEPRRRKGAMAMLNAYYGVEAAAASQDENGPGGVASSTAPMDRPDFDAKGHFDSIVAKGQVVDVVTRANDVDSEVRDLDGDMQMVVYENYSKFIRATDVTKQVKVSVDGLEPDLKSLENSFAKITEYQHKVEDAVSGRAREVEVLLKQQRICNKMQVLFDLPQTLQRCLDQGAHGNAVQAYSCCAPFLRQHKSIKTFQKVLEDVDLQMGRIRSSLQLRLRSADLSVSEAANSSLTLLELGEDRVVVVRDFLGGRSTALRGALDKCFPPASRDADESEALRTACASAKESYVPVLEETMDCFAKLHKDTDTTAGEKTRDDALSDFVRARIQDLFERVIRQIEFECPPADVIVSCVHSLRDSLRRVHALLPGLLTKLFCDFLSCASCKAMSSYVAASIACIVSDFAGLHEKCTRLQESKSSDMDKLLDIVGKVEQSLAARCLVAVQECEALVGLVASDRTAGQQFMRGLESQMVVLSTTFSNVCWACTGQEAKADAALAVVASSLPKVVQDMGELKWVGMFGLSLVWLGRRWDEKVVSKAWANAKNLFVGGEFQSDFVTDPAAAKATQIATEGVIAYYVLVSGQHLAHFLRNSLRSRDWMAAKEPQEPSMVIEMVFKEVFTFDSQLARILGDPRKPRSSNHRRVFNSINKTSMELELERMMAKKLQAFQPIPFSRNGAIVGILRIACKALYEYVREETFGKFGLQQIQVDTDLFAELARDFVDAEDAGTLASILGEVVNSATERCVEPVLMELSAVEGLCDRKKKGLRLD